MPRATVDFYVLDSVADDIEEGAHIAELVGRWDANAVSDVGTSLMRLVQQGLIEAYTYHPTDPTLVPVGVGTWPTGPWQEEWFRITPQGLMVHSAWEPEDEGQAI